MIIIEDAYCNCVDKILKQFEDLMYRGINKIFNVNVYLVRNLFNIY